MSGLDDGKKVGLDEILVLLDEFVGYEPEIKYFSNGEIKTIEHIIARNTWRKYVRLFNESIESYNVNTGSRIGRIKPKVEKIGKTKGTQYYLSDVNRVIEYSYTKKRLEWLWFDKTYYVPKKDTTENVNNVDQDLWDLFQPDIPEEDRLDQEEFIEKVRLFRKNNSELSNEPISKIAKIIGEEKVELHKREFQPIKHSELTEVHIQDLLSIFDLDVYKNICSPDTPSRLNIVFSIKKEIRDKIVEMEKYDRIDDFLFAAERNRVEDDDVFNSIDQEDLFETYLSIGDGDEFEELMKEIEENGGKGTVLLPDKEEAKKNPKI